MTERETEMALHALAMAVADLRDRLTRLEAFTLSVNKRLQLNEAGLSLYEINEPGRTLN